MDWLYAINLGGDGNLVKGSLCYSMSQARR